MSKSKLTTRYLMATLSMVLSMALIATACGSDEDTPDEGTLGTVEVAPEEAIQIRSLNTITGDVAFLGLPNQRAVEIAIADYGQIHGFDVDLGTGLDGLCSAEGGQAAAQTIVADEDVVGVIGTSCSGAAVAAAPLITEAGLAIISPSNTSPSLTSDLQGNANENYNVGYYRTAHNDLFQGEAVARFVYDKLELTKAAAVHDGDPYSQGLAQAFANAYKELGGEVTKISAVNKEDTDMVPILTEIAVDSPEALFFPIFQPAGDFLAEQVGDVDGLEDIALIAADALLVDKFLELPQSEGVFLAGPDTRYGDNTNQSTNKNAKEFLAAYADKWGEEPSAAFWAHAYDATTLLLDAIKEASTVADDGTLTIDRAGVRAHLDQVRDYSGLIGTINCDEYGDCGAGKITIIEHLDPSDLTASKENVVYEFAPSSS